MTKRELIAELASRFPDYSRRDTEVMVNTVLGAMTEALRNGDRIEIRGFGNFVVRQRRPRQARNPRTGTSVQVAAKRVPFFRVGKELWERINAGMPATRQRRAADRR